MKLPSTESSLVAKQISQRQQQQMQQVEEYEPQIQQQVTQGFSSGSSHDEDGDLSSRQWQEINKIGNKLGVPNMYAGIGKSSQSKSIKIKKEENKIQQEDIEVRKKRLFCGVVFVVFIVGIIMIGMKIQDSSQSSLPSYSSQLTAIFIITNSEKQSLKSINSFVSQNPISKLIIGSHIDYGKQQNKMTIDHSNIEWVVEKRPNYDIYFIDDLVSKVETQFFFYSNTEYYFNDGKFVDFSIRTLKQFTEVSQVMGIVGNQVQNRDLAERKVGFTFLPGVHRKEDYLLAPEGYASITKQSSSDLEKSQVLISRFYLGSGKYVMVAPGSFHIQSISEIQNKKSKNANIKSTSTKKSKNKNLKQKMQQTTPRLSVDSLVPNKNYFNQQRSENSFKNNFYNSQYFSKMQEYLSHNKVQKLLLVNCNELCSSRYSSQMFQNRIVSKFSEVEDETEKQVYDWISFERFAPFLNDVMERSVNIGQFAKYGVSLIWNMEGNSDKVTSEINEYFIAKGFYYDEAKSLCLRRVQQKIVMIFIKGQKQKQKYKPEFHQEPLPNFLALQTVFKLRQNLPYLREWLLYHIDMGFDKFYLYDNTNSIGSNLDPKSSKFKNKFGMSLDCVMLETQAMDQWRYLWAQFYDHIVYVLWQPKDQFQRIIYGQVESQHDFLQYYKQIPKYTLFIDIDEYIFSPLDQKLQTYLSHYSANRITSIKLKQRHFESRFCSKNKRVIEIQNYFPEDDDRLWGVKVMAQTIYFSPFGDISEGRVNVGRQIVVPSDQFRINHYNFQKNALRIARKNKYSTYTKFQTDNSMSRHKQRMDKLCNNKCSQIFAINCPAGQQWNTCLDVTKTFTNFYQQQPQPTRPIIEKKEVVETPKQVSPKQAPPNPTPNPYPEASYTRRPNQPAQKISDELVTLMRSLVQPSKVFQIQLIKQLPSVEMCLFVHPSSTHSLESLQTSISIQNYPNVKAVIKPQTALNYYTFYQMLLSECQQNAFIMFITTPLKEGALLYINKVMQKFRAWTAYTKNDLATEIVGFYLRIYEMLDINDFTGRNKELMKNQNIVHQVFGMLELCLESAKQLEKEQIYQNANQYAYFSVLRSNEDKLQRSSYTALIRLSQDFDTNVAVYQRSRQGISSARVSPLMKLNTDNMYRAIDRQQEWFLPQSHSIVQLEYEQYSTLYNISEYKSIEKQVRFCITILNHNNVQNNRYIKVMKSIIMQKYENYHIVFIDDNSTDDNLNKTMEYMNKVGFPRDRITYVQNLRRNFATYNIINAAFNFCAQDDVQMLMDGDDQFVGRYAFQVMNSAYQRKEETWVAYSNYKSNFYGFGRSRGLTSDYDHAAGSRRSYVSFFGAIRSFRVKMVRNIPPLHHKMSDKQWLDTVYDDALCHPLFELSGYKRVVYIPELLYEYNMRYGDNDDSTSQKIRHRSEVYRYMISLQTLSKLDNLTMAIKDAEIQFQLKNDLNVRYLVVQT